MILLPTYNYTGFHYIVPPENSFIRFGLVLNEAGNNLRRSYMTTKQIKNGIKRGEYTKIIKQQND